MENVSLANQLAEQYGNRFDHALSVYIAQSSVNVRSALDRCGLVQRDAKLSPWAEDFFLAPHSSTNFFTFVTYSSGAFPSLSAGYHDAFFLSWLHLCSDVESAFPRIEDRSAIERRSLPEIDPAFFRSVLAYSLSRTLPFKDTILLENIPQFYCFSIRGFVVRPRSEEMLTFLRFLRFLREIPSDDYARLSQARRTGLLQENGNASALYEKILYRTARKTGQDIPFFEGRFSPTEKTALDLILKKGKTTRKEMVAETGLSPRAVSYAMKSLVNKGIICRIGDPTSILAFYVMKNNEKNERK